MLLSTATPFEDRLRLAPLTGKQDLLTPPADVDLLYLPSAPNATYVVGFGISKRCIERALRLRYEVFNVELGEGLMSSRATGLDRDEFDDQMAHLILMERATDRVVGTYRVQNYTEARQGVGLYSAREYDIDALDGYGPELVETGRACIAEGHRSYAAIILLWKALSAYMSMFEKRYLFGCCSLTTVDTDEGWRAMKTLRGMNVLHPSILMHPLPAYSCGSPEREFAPDLGPEAKIPRLFATYLTLGSEVVSLPAIDREFGTVDFLILLDVMKVNFSSVMLR